VRITVNLTDKLEKKAQKRASGSTIAAQIAADLGLFYGLMDAVNVETRGAFNEAEIRFLTDLLKDIALDVSTIRSWDYTISTLLEDATVLSDEHLSYGVDLKALSKKVKNLSKLGIAWLVDEVKMRKEV